MVRNLVGPGYFAATGVSLLEGRAFGSLDGVDGGSVAIVSAALADRLWPGRSAIGQTLLTGEPREPTEATVVGVVRNARHVSLNMTDVPEQVYQPIAALSGRRFFLVGRAANDPADLTAAMRTALAGVAPALPVEVRPMDDVIAENQLQWSLSSVFLGVFGGGAMLLALLGIYGLVSFSVAQRVREIGVRIALGATGQQIRRAVVGDALRLTGIGLGLGLLGSLGLGRAMSSLLFGISPNDPLTLAIVVFLFSGVAAVASFVPAARAAGTDPIEVLRSE